MFGEQIVNKGMGKKLFKIVIEASHLNFNIATLYNSVWFVGLLQITMKWLGVALLLAMMLQSIVAPPVIEKKEEKEEEKDKNARFVSNAISRVISWNNLIKENIWCTGLCL